MDTKNQEFSEIPFQCIFNEFGFLLDISSKINLHVWFYFIVFLTILSITLETGHMESSVLLSLSASCFPFCSSLISKTLQKYHRIGKYIANHIVNFNSYKLCLSDIFDGQEY